MDRTAGWILASIAMVAAAVLRVAANDDEEHSSAYLVGGALGAIVAGVLIGLLLRFVYVRLIRKDQPVWSPWVLVIAAVVSLLVAASRAGDNTGEAADTATGKESCDGPAATAEELVATLPEGWRSAPADEELIRSMKADMPPGTNVRITGRAVGRGEPAAAVVVFELEKPSDTDEFMSGVADEAGEDRVEEVALGEARAKLYRADDGGATVAGRSAPCAATLIFGASPRIARELAGEMPVEG